MYLVANIDVEICDTVNSAGNPRRGRTPEIKGQGLRDGAARRANTQRASTIHR